LRFPIEGNTFGQEFATCNKKRSFLYLAFRSCLLIKEIVLEMKRDKDNKYHVKLENRAKSGPLEINGGQKRPLADK
jgi:hypothetical protein